MEPFGKMDAFKLVVLALLIPIFVWAFASMEKRLIFYPERTIWTTPADRGLSYEDVFFHTSDGVRLNGWFVPGDRRGVALLWFHGNAGNIADRVENIALFHDRLGIHIFIFDYRGYGRSEGSVSEEGTYRDAEAALAYLRSRRDIDPAKIILFGRSLGAAVAVELAAKMPCAGLILESPFTSVKEMADLAFPFFPVGLFFRTKYDTLSKIKQIKIPVLVLHGDRDEIVPFSMGRRIFEAANEPKTFFTIKGAGHNDTYQRGGRAYLQALDRFIKEAAG
ncbi:MAG: alpha/beta hydrolase [Candidatus Methylomirabilales bacterium]